MAIMNDRHSQWCRVSHNLSRKILLCILYLSLGAAVAEIVIVDFDNSSVSKVIACAGTSVQVDWGFYHNIMETETAACNSGDIKEWHGDEDAPYSETFATLSAKPGTTRYYKCSYHCGQTASRFEVSCPAKEVNCKNKKKNEFLLTKKKKTCNQRFKKITNKKKRKRRCKQKTKIYNVKKEKFVKNKTLKQICPLYCNNKCFWCWKRLSIEKKINRTKRPNKKMHWMVKNEEQ